MGFLDKLFGGGSDDEKDESEATEAAEQAEASGGEALPEETLDPSTFWATVLFPYPLEYGAGDIEELFEDAGLNVEGVEATSGSTYEVEVPEQTFVLEQRDEAFSRDHMDRRILPETFPDDFSYVGIRAEREELLEKRNEHREPSDFPDPWGGSGVMRMLTKLVRKLLERDGLAVVLNQAGQLTVPSQRFLELTERVDEAESRPFLGWLDIAYDDEGEYLRSFGLELFGYPEIFVHRDHDDDQWRMRREQEALVYAASEMVHENRVLGSTPDGDGFLGFEAMDAFEVPLGVNAQDERLEIEEDWDVTSYDVAMEDEHLVLRSDEPATVWETWATIDDEDVEISRPAYQAMFQHECRKTIGAHPLASVVVDEFEEIEPFDCDIYRTEEGGPVHLITNGLGRTPRPADEEGTEHHRVELAVRTMQDGGEILDLMASAAVGIELSEEPWNSADIIEFEEPLHNLQHFIIGPLFDVDPDSGPTIEVWQLVPLTDEEYDDISDGDALGWLEEHDYAMAPEYVERWMAVYQ